MIQQNKNSPKRILLWSPFGSGQHYCGPATYTHRVYSKFDPSEFRSTLAHGYADQSQEPVFQRQQFIHSFGSGISANLQFVSKGKKWFNRHKSEFDLFHAISGFHGSIAVANLAKRHGLPVVLFISILNGGLESHKGLKRTLGVYHRRRKSARKFDALIALSSEIEAQLLSLGFNQSQIVRIPNFADTERFCSVSKSRRDELRARFGMQQCPAIAFVGRVSDRKRPHLILEALKELKTRGQEVQCAFIGPYEETDPYYVDMKNFIKKHHLTDQVVFSGFTTNVENWIQACDVFCLPSSNEGMPGALIEAISCGLPAIVSPFSSAHEVVCDRKLGMVLQDDDGANEIADGVIEAIKEGDAGKDFRRNAVIERYSLDAVAKMHTDLFKRLLVGQPANR